MTFMVYGLYIEQKNHFYSNKPFYVGKTNDMAVRMRSHRHMISKFHTLNCFTYFLYKKLCEFEDLGYTWKYKVYKTFENEDDALNCERMLIKKIGRVDIKTGILFNSSNGGEGFALSPDVKERIKNSLLRRSKDFWSEEKLNYIKERYLSGVSINVLKREINAHAWSIRYRLKQMGVPIRLHKESTKYIFKSVNRAKYYGWTEEHLNKIKNLYESGTKISDIAKSEKLDPTTIIKRLRSIGIVVKKAKPTDYKKYELTSEQIREVYRLHNEEFLSFHKIVIKLQLPINADSLRNKFKKIGFKCHSREEINERQKIKFSDEKIKEIITCYNDLNQIHQVAIKFNVADSVIKRILQEQGVCQYAI